MRIEWSDEALGDAEEIRRYIERDSRFYARRFVDRLVAVVEKLSDFPRIGRKVPEIERDEIRELIVDRYRIIYRLGKERIDILAIVHGSRDFSGERPSPWE